MRTLIKNGTILTAENEFMADILIKDQIIEEIGRNIVCNADNIIDAEGMYVFPGGVDQHTHFDALCNVGNQDTAGYETTKATIVGGTTTIIDYAPQYEGKNLIESIDFRRENRAKGRACVDYAFHSLVTEASDIIFDDLRRLPEIGVSSIKVFMAYKGSPLYADDGVLYRVLREAKDVGVTVFVHTENADLIDMMQKEEIKKGNTAPKYHAVSRPPLVEYEAAQRAIIIAQSIDSPMFIAHVSCKEVVDRIRNARREGARIFGETCTQYLVLTEDKLDGPTFEKSIKYICSPALRPQHQLDAMWESIQNGWLDVVASDHCGISIKGMKDYGKDKNFAVIPNGAPGSADRLAMLWTMGVATGKLSKKRFVDVFATKAAKFNGIYPRKGTIAVGSDADIVVFDPNLRGAISNETNPNGVDYNIYEGMETIGAPKKIFLRGNLVVDDGKFVGKLGQGEFIWSDAFAEAYQNRKD